MEQQYLKAILKSQKEIKQELDDLKTMVSDLMNALGKQSSKEVMKQKIEDMERDMSIVVGMMCIHYDNIITEKGFLSIDNPKYSLFERFDELIEENYLALVEELNLTPKLQTVDYIYNRDDTEKMYFDLTDEIRGYEDVFDLQTEQECVDILEQYLDRNGLWVNRYDPFKLDELEEEEFDAMQYLDLEI